MPLSTSEVNQQVRTAAKLYVKRFIQALVDIFRDNWCHLIKEELVYQVSEDTFKKYRYLITQELNILKRVIKEISVVYKEEPIREAITTREDRTGDEPVEVEDADPVYEVSQKDTNKNFAMQAVNEYTTLSNHTMLKINWRDEKLDYDVILFNNVEVYTDPLDWMKIVAVKFYHGLDTDYYGASNNGYGCGITSVGRNVPIFNYDSNTKGVAEGPLIQQYHSAELWVIEDIENNGIIENGSTKEIIKGGYYYTIKPTSQYEMITEETEIPYLDNNGKPILPFVLFSKDYPVDRLLNFTSGNDLRDININVAMLLIYLNSLEKYNSFKQVVFSTDDPDKIPDNIKLNPNSILVNPTKDGNGSVTVLDMTTDTDKKLDAIKNRIFNVLAGYGISPENFSMSGDAQSGFALKISNIGKIEARKKQLPMYRRKEKEVFNIERIIWNYHNPTKKINEDAEFKVDFAEIDFPKDPSEQVKVDEFDLRHNIITEIDIIMRKNPDLDEEQAKKIWQENKEFNQAALPQMGLQPVQQPGQQKQPQGVQNGMQQGQAPQGQGFQKR